MKIIELYSDDILDVISLGQSFSTFDEKNGDYIKIELRDAEIDTTLHTFYSNRLIFKYSVLASPFDIPNPLHLKLQPNTRKNTEGTPTNCPSPCIL